MKKLFFAIAIMAALVGCKNNNEPTSGDNPTPSGKDTTAVDPAFDAIVVSTEAENRKAVIEEYTGINCGYCPDGHRIVNEVMAEYPGQVFGLNIHAGSYAAQYKTSDGTKYMNDAGPTGFPTGVVNRHVFSGTNMCVDRSAFKSKCLKIMKMSSPVNIGATAEINKATRELTVLVKGYYTGAPEEGVTTNSLYVLLVQDSVMGKQSGGSTYNPDQMIDGQYCHMHMFRGAISATWGDEISPIAAGSWFTKKYVYTIPETIGTDKVATVLEHMHVLIYVAAGKREIYTVAKPDVVLK